MKTLFCILALVLAGCGGGGSTPVEQAAATWPTTVEPIVGNQSQAFGLVVYVGDDITWQYCQVPLTAPWGAYQFEEPNGVCLGARGETSEGTAARFTQVIAMRPKAIVLETGLNDVRDGDIDQSHVVDMVNAAQHAGIVVVLGTLPPSAGLNVLPWNAGIRQISAMYGTGLADYYAGMVDPSTSESPQFFPELLTTPLLTPYGVYPSAAGFQVMWGIVCEPLDPLGVFAS